MAGPHSFFVTAARGLVPLVADELQQLGARVVRPEPGGVRVRGPLSFGYRICLWSRCASRVILHLHDAAIGSVDDLYQAAYALAWEDHLAPEGTLCVDVVARGEVITHSQFAAQRVKDAVVDRMRARFGQRPSVDLHAPDVRIAVYVRGRGCSIGIDLSGESLHRRHWRGDHGPAPIKENLAAALLLRADWPARASAGEPLVDPVCGAGTIAIEAACIAADRAPALLRARFGFTHWRGHDIDAWTELSAEARARAEAGATRELPSIVGHDVDRRVLEHARGNATRAGVAAMVRFEPTAVVQCRPPQPGPGLVVGNPPYGERLGSEAAVRQLYQELDATLRREFDGWHAELIVAESSPTELLGLPVDPQTIDNGAIPCRWVAGTVGAPLPEPSDDDGDDAPARPRGPAIPEAEIAAFRARLQRNLAKLQPWLDRYQVECVRLYDSDVPNFRAIIDRYGAHVHLQEYQAPRKVDPQLAGLRLQAMIDVTAEVLGVRASAIAVKRRRSQAAAGQYGRFADRGEELLVREGPWRFLVNLHDYLDTGLFLDHRGFRRLVASSVAKGMRVLNLFAYTGTISVAAAHAGARTTTVDLSNRYLEWARRNFAANALDVRAHEFVRADIVQWLAQHRGRYDLIVCDPPSYSASKAMVGTFEIERDHPALLRACIDRLADGGTLLFSTNKRGFVLDPELTGFVDVTASTLDPDVQREPPPHRAWRYGGRTRP